MPKKLNRFSSNGDMPFAHMPFKEGEQVRATGSSRETCPYRPAGEMTTGYFYASWMAGWSDTDQGILADEESEKNHDSSSS